MLLKKIKLESTYSVFGKRTTVFLDACQYSVYLDIFMNSCFVIPGTVNMETVTVKAEPRPREEYWGEIPFTNVDVDLLDVKCESLKDCEGTTLTAGKTVFFLFKFIVRALLVFIH